MGQTAGYVAIMIAVGSIFFEVSKIKINPISFLLKWIGKRMFEPMNSRLDAVEKKIDDGLNPCCFFIKYGEARYLPYWNAETARRNKYQPHCDTP